MADRRFPDSGNDLAVGVMKFKPSVVCSPQPFGRDARVLGACEAIVDKLKVSKDLELFSNPGFHSRDSDIALPLSYTAPGEGSADPLYDLTKVSKLTKNPKEPICILRLTGTRPRNVGSWFAIWETAVAITAMCIRQGKGGSWEGLGKFGTFSPRVLGFAWLMSYYQEKLKALLYRWAKPSNLLVLKRSSYGVSTRHAEFRMDSSS